MSTPYSRTPPSPRRSRAEPPSAASNRSPAAGDGVTVALPQCHPPSARPPAPTRACSARRAGQALPLLRYVFGSQKEARPCVWGAQPLRGSRSGLVGPPPCASGRRNSISATCCPLCLQPFLLVGPANSCPSVTALLSCDLYNEDANSIFFTGRVVNRAGEVLRLLPGTQ